jgi:CDP-diacylglycerol--glycerol-3-phosphate 3-phosphatidyltransferase
MWITEPIARFFIRLGASPNDVTILGLVMIAGAATLLALGHLRLAGFLMLIGAGADGVDGVMARLQDRSTQFGAFLDSTLDRYSEAVTLLGLFIYFLRLGDGESLVLLYVAIVGSLLVSYTRARAESVGLECQKGLLTRVERVILLMTALIVGQVRIGLWLLAILSQLTALQRIYVVWRASKEASDQETSELVEP